MAGTFTYTPAAGTVLGAGNNQTLSVAFTPTDTTDYTTASATATINVLQATPTISWSNPANIVYGTALSGTQLDATSSWTVGGESGSVAGTFTYTPAAGTVLAAGNNQTLSVAFTPTDTTDYTTASATAMINVLQATPTISWSNPANIVYGTALSGTQLDATSSWTVGGESGSVAGTFTYTPAAGTVLGAGNNQTLSVAFTPTDTTDYTAASTTATINVLQATTTTVATSVNPSVYGQSVTFTATVAAVAPGSGAPTGLVTFDDGTTVLGTGTLNGGVATFSTSSLSVATHSITAVYGGDGNFTTSTSSVLSQAVNQDSTSTALSSSVNPSVYGQSVTFTATVTANAPGSGTPSGSVIFMDGTSTLGTGTLNASSAATFTTSALSVASHPITAVYGGDTNDLISTSEPLSQVVNTDTTTTTLTSSVNPSVFRQPVTFTAAVTVVSPGAGTPSGTVTFMDGSTTLGTSSLNGSGVAIFSITSLSVATHSITAVYGGDGNFTTSTSSAVIQTVNQASTTTSLTASPTSTTSGQPVTLTATIAVVAPGAGMPTGSVQFFVGTTSLGTASLSGTSAILTTTLLPVGTDSLTAAIPGRLQLHRQHVERCLGHDQLRRDRHDHYPRLLQKSVGLRPVGHLDRHRKAFFRQRHAHGNRDLLRRLDGPRHRDTQQQEGIPQDDGTPSRLAVNHRGLQRGRQQCSQHLRGPHSNGQPGCHHDSRRFCGESVGLRAALDVYGDGERELTRQRDADRHDHVLLRLDAARHGHAQRWDRHPHDVVATYRRQSHHQGVL